jgi:hypothetical protein
MKRDFLILLGLALVVVLLLRTAKAQDPTAPQVTTGSYGARIDYDDTASGGRGCCG